MSKIRFEELKFKGNNLCEGRDNNRWQMLTLKYALIDKGYKFKRPTTSIFDSETKRIVEQYQEDNDLLIDGIVGMATWYAIVSPELSKNLIEFIKDWEIGPDRNAHYSHGMFTCADVGDGKRTIGYGTTPPYHDYDFNEECTKAKAEEIFINSLIFGIYKNHQAYASTVNTVCQTLGNCDIYLTHNQYEALVDLQYNSGAVGNCGDIIKLLDDGKDSKNRKKISQAFLQKKYLSTDSMFIGVFSRRYAELKLFLDGEYNNNKLEGSEINDIWKDIFGRDCPYL